MNCIRAQHAIQRDLDGELTPLRKRALRRHLAGCDACRVAMQHHAAIRSAMTRLAAMSSAQLGGGHLAHLSQRECAPSATLSTHPHPSLWRRAAAIAAVLALCITGWRIAAMFREPKPEIAAIPVESTPSAPPPIVRIELDPSSDAIAIPKPSHNPNITVLWIYPTVKTAEATPASAIEPDPISTQGAHS